MRKRNVLSSSMINDYGNGNYGIGIGDSYGSHNVTQSIYGEGGGYLGGNSSYGGSVAGYGGGGSGTGTGTGSGTGTGFGSSAPAPVNTNTQQNRPLIPLPKKFIVHNHATTTIVWCKDGTKGNNTSRPCYGHGGIMREDTPPSTSGTGILSGIISGLTGGNADTGNTDTGNTDTGNTSGKINYLFPIIIFAGVIIGYYTIKKVLKS